MGAMTFAGILVGAAICYGVAQEGIKFYRDTPAQTASGDMSFICNRAMSANNIRDNGGCRCIAEAAIKDGKLNHTRIQALSSYFLSLETTKNGLDGKVPTPLQLSREIGLVYGHPFLRAYGQCARTGFASLNPDE